MNVNLALATKHYFNQNKAPHKRDICWLCQEKRPYLMKSKKSGLEKYKAVLSYFIENDQKSCEKSNIFKRFRQSHADPSF